MKSGKIVPRKLRRSAGRALPHQGELLARERFSSKREEMFDIMRSESPFTFDFAATTVESVIDTSKEGK